MAVTLLRVLVLGVIAAAADDVPITWEKSARALLPCVVPDADKIPARKPPPPLADDGGAKHKPYKWWRGTEELSGVFTNGSLEVLKSENGKADGLYQCALWQGGLILGYPINLKFAYIEKQFPVLPVEATGKLGQPVLLSCDVNAAAVTTLVWLRDGVPLPQNPRYYQIQNQLLITEVSNEDAGLYRCKADSNESGSSQLRVEPSNYLEPALLHLHLETNIFARKGSRVVLPCPVVGWPRPKLLWQLTPPEGRLNELEFTDEILVLHHIEYDQEGVYKCSLDSTGKLLKVFNVTITEPVVITAPPVSINTARAYTIRFNCTAEGKPTPVVSWYKDGKPLSLTGTTAVLASVDSKRRELLIRMVTTENAGVYQCFARSGPHVASAWARLDVWGAEAAAPHNVTCAPLSTSSVRVSWPPIPADILAYVILRTSPSGQKLPIMPFNNSLSTEKVLNLEPLTQYGFQVQAYIRVPVTNRTIPGKMSETVICQGQGVPIKLARKDNNILVYWKNFADVTPGVLEWILQYRSNNSTEEHNITLDGGTFNYTVHVSASSEYEFRLLGTKKLPWLQQNLELVPWSSTASASNSIDGDVSVIPKDLEAVNIGPREFTVKWRCDDAPENFVFDVCITKDDHEECVASRNRWTVVSDLQPGAAYGVRVVARGRPSATLRVTTTREDQGNINIEHKFINISTVRVSWHSEPDKYIVHYSNELKLPVEEWASIEAYGNTALITGVDMTKELFVMVTAPSKPVNHRAIKNIVVPEAKNLRYEYESAKVIVRWDGEGPRLVKYSQNLTQSLDKWPSINLLDTHVEISGLNFSRPTYVMVSASNPSQNSQVLNVPPLSSESSSYSTMSVGVFIGVCALCVCMLVAVCVWRRNKRARETIRSRRRNASPTEGREEAAEMRTVGGRLANGGSSKDAGEPLLNGHVHITENPTQSKTPNGRLAKRFEGAFDVARYEPDTTLETTLETSLDSSARGPAHSASHTHTHTHTLLDTSRRPDYDKLPDDNMNSQLNSGTDFVTDNSKIQPTLQPNG